MTGRRGEERGLLVSASTEAALDLTLSLSSAGQSGPARPGPGDVTSWLSPSHQLGQQYRLGQEPVLSQISSLTPSHHTFPSSTEDSGELRKTDFTLSLTCYNVTQTIV